MNGKRNQENEIRNTRNQRRSEITEYSRGHVISEISNKGNQRRSEITGYSRGHVISETRSNENQRVSGINGHSRGCAISDISNRRSQSGKAQSLRVMKKRTKAGFLRFALAFAVVSAVVCVILISSRSVISAEETKDPVQLQKYYKTITVQRGESLWTIAENYKSGAYRTVQAYVDELKSINKLSSDHVTAGNKLVIAYFEES